jgi:uroporphyrinogen decarboxylase
MNSKERVIKTLNFEKPDRVPFNFWMDRRLMQQYDKEFGNNFRINHYGADVIESFARLDFSGGLTGGKSVEKDGSWWGVEPSLKDWADAGKIIMPDPTEDKVYENIKKNLHDYPDKAILVNIPGPFTMMHGYRLMDNLFYDVYEHPEELHKLIKKVMDVQNAVIKNTVKLPITAVYFQDDIASSSGLMFSLPMIQEFVFDYFREGVELAKKAGKHVLFHSDGNVTEILDSLIKMGIHAVNPLQPDFNDFDEFHKKYHKKLAVYGALDNTKIIPNGTISDIQKHVRNAFEILGSDGGLIMSTHDIPIHCPRENLDVMVSSILKCVY